MAFNPFSGFQPLSPLGVNPLSHLSQQQNNGPQFPPLEPQEQQSVLGQLGSSSLSGLAYLGSSLEKAFGGRAIRGLLGGRPEELLSIIPFSDTLGITNYANRVSGTELFGGPREHDFLSPEGIGGIALEIALDPLTYMSFGGSALNKLGRSARQAGVAPATRAARLGGYAAGSDEAIALAAHTGQTAAQVANKPLGSLATFRFPGFGPVQLGEGATGQSIANAVGKFTAPITKYSGLDMLGRNVLDPVGRGIKSLFVKGTNESVSDFGQLANQKAAAWYDKTGLPGAHQHNLDLAKLIKGHGFTGDEPAVQAAMEQLLPATHPNLAGLQDLAAYSRQRGLDQLSEAGRMGLDNPSYVSKHGTGYAHRSELPLDRPTPGYGGMAGQQRELQLRNQSMMQREDILDIPGGRVEVNRLSVDKAIKALADNPAGSAAAVTPIRHQFLGGSVAEDAALSGFQARVAAGTAPLTAQEAVLYQSLIEKQEQAVKLADWIRSMDPQRALNNKPIFGNNVLTDFLHREVAQARSVSNARGIMDMMAASAVPTAGPDTMSLLEAIHASGLTNKSQGRATEVATRLAALGKSGQAHNMHVPKEMVADATRYLAAWQSPEAFRQFLHVFDGVTNLTKASQTVLWPAHLVRNRMTGGFWNWVKGWLSPETNAAANAIYKGDIAKNLSKIHPQFAGMTDDQVTRIFAEKAFINGLNPGELLADTTGAGANVAKAALRLPGPGNIQLGPVQAFLEPWKKIASGKATWDELNPLGIRGIGGRNVDTNILVQGGRESAVGTDMISKLEAMVGAVKQGYSLDAAAMHAKALHMDYSQLSRFEREVMRRVIPFYSFMRFNTPLVLKELVENPGGRMAMSVKVGGQARGDPDEFLPSYLGAAGGLALPVGQEQDGKQRFLSSLGLPFEDIGQLMSVRGVLGQLNPLLKAPAEAATNRQFFSGREMTDIHGATGNILLDQGIMNSPLSRMFTSGRTLLSNQKDVFGKALNLLTGARLTDVDMARSRSLAIREAVQDYFASNPNVRHLSRMSVRPEQMQNLTPYEVQLLRLNATQEQAARQAAQSRAAGQ